ncbi:MAG: DUF4974 domain-containing protein [Bacteroidales bacterium]|nr:MAG: DUF4974 domain-containing protein [Bacteroidales bacterium]
MAEKRKMTYDEILMSEEFQAFMKEKDEESALYWKKFVNDNKEIRNEFDKAVSLYKVLTNHKKVKFPDKLKQESADRLMSLISACDKELFRKNRYSMVNIFKLVASIAILVGLSWLLGSKLNVFNSSGKNLYHEIVVPSGEKSQVYLSDGTKIWLNSESKLRYPAGYNKSERDVFLEGEGYFDISKQKGSHFTVYTQDIKVEALGTIFNIKSYPGDQTIETTLVEGSVKVEHSKKNKFAHIILKPNERFVYRKYVEAERTKPTIDGDKKDTKSTTGSLAPIQQISVSKVNTENITCWKDHLLVFDNETLEEMAVKISRWYKLKVTILDDELRNHRFTGKFINNETIYSVLEAIDLTTPIVYDIKDNNLKIDFDRKR